MLRFLLWLLSQPLFWAISGVCVGPYLFYRGFRLLELKRRIMNVPQSSIRAAAIGPVEICGTAVGPYTVVAPLSRCDCLYYRLVVESNPRGDLGSRIHEMCAPLFVDDGTGTMMVFPKGSELKLAPTYRRAEYGKLAVMLASRYQSETPEFSQEYSIRPGDKIFVLGTLRENTWARKKAREVDDLSRIGPGFVCAGEADLQRKDTFPLLNPNLPSVPVSALADKLDLEPPVILMKGDGPFVISSGSERDLLSKLAWTSLLFIWSGPLWALWGLWEILSQPAVWAAVSGTR